MNTPPRPPSTASAHAASSVTTAASRPPLRGGRRAAGGGGVRALRCCVRCESIADAAHVAPARRGGQRHCVLFALLAAQGRGMKRGYETGLVAQGTDGGGDGDSHDTERRPSVGTHVHRASRTASARERYPTPWLHSLKRSNSHTLSPRLKWIPTIRSPPCP